MDKSGYVIICYDRDNKVKYLSKSTTSGKKPWTYSLRNAKIYTDLSEAKVKVSNIKCDKYTLNAKVMYLRRDGKLCSLLK